MLGDDARIPAHIERERLRSLDQLGIIGTAPEERFDQIIRVAKMMFGVPMGSISVLDDQVQWFKSVAGLAEAPIPRDETVCQVTIARAYRNPTNPVLLLEDASTVANFASLPGIGGDDGVRFYAGHPLYGPGGHAVGVFCIYDSVPRTLDSTQLSAFAELAEWVQREMERADELNRAAQIQRELLPRNLIDLPGFDVATLCLPAYSVGGDFYDHYPARSGASFTVADVMGKGIGAAILTATLRSALRGLSHALDPGSGVDLASIVGAASVQLSDDFDRTGSFATLFHCRLDVSTAELEYVDAGHAMARVRRATGQVERVETSGLPLGIGDSWETGRLELEPGEMLVICSDGLLDLLDENSNPEVLTAFVAKYTSPEDVVDAARQAVQESLPIDDVTVVAIRRKPTA